MANQGRRARSAAYRTRSSPTGARPSFVGVAKVVLADVDVVGLAERRQVGPVVHDEGHAEPASD
jgi:hypothetical protein